MGDRGNTREMILKTASRLFQLQGYHGTGLNQIIAESHAPKGSLYYYFPNGKEELAIEAIKYTEQLLLQETKDTLYSVEDPVAAFQLHIKEISAPFDGKNNMEGLPIGLVASETAQTCDAIRRTCVVTFKKWQTIYAKKLESCGYKKKDAEELAVFINAMIEGAIVLSLTNQSSRPLQLVSNRLPVLLAKT